MELPLALHTTSGKCRTRLKRRGFDTSCSCQTKFKGKRFVYRTSCSRIQKKRLLQDHLKLSIRSSEEEVKGPAVITGQNSKERGFVHNQLKLLDKTQRRGSYRTGWSCQIKLKEEVLTGLVGLVGRNKRWTYNTSWSCRDATQKEEVLKM